VLPRLTSVGLLATGAGFVGAAVNPGRGPRTVQGSLTVGPLYLPPLLVGLIAVLIAGLVLISLRWWMSSVGAMLAVILLVGSTTLGADAVSYRLTHPAQTLGFTEDWLQILGETMATVAGLAATVQHVRQRKHHDDRPVQP